MRKRLKIGISACLLGLRYRYDGTSKFSREIVELLRDHADLVPVCPEVECGLSIPRPPMRLESTPKGIRLIVIETGEDVTDQMKEWAANRVEQLDRLDLAAFIFKSKSPSCGLCCKVWNRSGKELPLKGEGLFAKALRRHRPEMFICQETDFPAAAEKLKW